MFVEDWIEIGTSNLCRISEAVGTVIWSERAMVVLLQASSTTLQPLGGIAGSVLVTLEIILLLWHEFVA
jgi:hypothetical protein